MKLIVKNKLASLNHKLKNFKSEINGIFPNLSQDLKNELLNALLEEQGFLCAYCMRKINEDNATIEHIIGQKYKDENDREIGQEEQLNYENLLAVCEGNSCRELHCDKSRANYQKNRPLYVTPLENRIMSNIKFTNNGVIFYEKFIEVEKIEGLRNYESLTESQNIKYDIQKVLNLNCNNLKEKREIIIKALKKYTKDWSNKEKIKKELYRYQTKNSGEYEEICQVAIYFLNKKLYE